MTQHLNCNCGQMMHFDENLQIWKCDYCGFSKPVYKRQVFENFQSAYKGLLSNVLYYGNKVKVRDNEMLETIPCYFEILNPRDRLLNIKCRNDKIRKYTFGELMWYLSGKDNLNFINKYSKQWAKLSDDGVHCNSAYGKYIFGQMLCHGDGVNYKDSGLRYSQWEWCKKQLLNDMFTRQAVIQIKPIQMYDTKDVACTYFLQFMIRNNKLDLIVGMRSNDLMFGTTYDVFMFTFLQELMAAEIGICVGTYRHFASNMHIYCKDIPKVYEILSENETSTEEMYDIPKYFRENDLPLLLKLENSYVEGYGIPEENKRYIKSLSPLGKQLLSFLIGDNHESSIK